MSRLPDKKFLELIHKFEKICSHLDIVKQEIWKCRVFILENLENNNASNKPKTNIESTGDSQNIDENNRETAKT